MKDFIMNDIRSFDCPLESKLIDTRQKEKVPKYEDYWKFTHSWTRRYQQYMYVYLAGSIYDLQYVFLTVVFQLGGKCWEKWQGRSYM